MPPPNILNIDGPLAGVRGLEEITIGTDDIPLVAPSYIVLSTAGDLLYVDSVDNPFTLMGGSAGDIVHLGATGIVIPVFVALLRGSTAGTTVTKVIRGIL